MSGDSRLASGGERRILYMINAGGRAAPEIIRGLTRLPDVRLTVTVGRDERLRRAVEGVNAEAARKFEIVGWSDQLPRLMLESHLLISKAGGATVQETIAAKCPMIISQVVPGQEEGNARLIEETRSGAVATTAEAIIAAVGTGLCGRRATLARMVGKHQPAQPAPRFAGDCGAAARVVGRSVWPACEKM